MSEQQYEIEQRMHDALAARDKRIEELVRNSSFIRYDAEIQSNYDRVKIAERLSSTPYYTQWSNRIMNYGRRSSNWSTSKV